MNLALDVNRDLQLAWAAGLFEGEGWIRRFYCSDVCRNAQNNHKRSMACAHS